MSRLKPPEECRTEAECIKYRDLVVAELRKFRERYAPSPIVERTFATAVHRYDKRRDELAARYRS